MGKMIRGVDHYFLKKPFMKNAPCADLGHIQESKDSLFFAIADVAGHGDEAHRLSLVVKKYLIKSHSANLVNLMKGLHTLLKGTRGAVGLAGVLYKRTGAVKYVGIGNISMRKFGERNQRVISNEGILGYVIRTPKMERLQLLPGEVLLLYTDGIRDYFDANECPEGLLGKNAKHIAQGIMKRFYRGSDDAACIAMRYKND